MSVPILPRLVERYHKPFFLPNDIRHTQCPSCFILERCKFCGRRQWDREKSKNQRGEIIKEGKSSANLPPVREHNKNATQEIQNYEKILFMSKRKQDNSEMRQDTKWHTRRKNAFCLLGSSRLLLHRRKEHGEEKHTGIRKEKVRKVRRWRSKAQTQENRAQG